ncbi:unnamed protein product [Umbelopsis sp. WA50703]
MDIQSIQKCPIDYDCQFIPLDENALSERSRSGFVIFQEKYFVVHLGGYEIKCDYNCRNRVMTFLRRTLHLYPQDIEKLVNNNFGLDLIDGVVHNNELPHIIFSNEKSSPFDHSTNTIMEKYTSVDIQQFAEITRTKPCKQGYFVIYLGKKEVLNPPKNRGECQKFVEPRYICCSTKSLQTYEYNHELKSRVDKLISEDVDACIATMKSEDEALELKKPAKRILNFRLVDVDGYPVEENIDYCLQLFDHSEDVLKFCDYAPKFYATYRLNRSETIVVRYSITGSIHYLTYENQYLQLGDDQDEFRFDKEIPGKDRRLEFHVTENNAFKIVPWDDDVWLTFKKDTLNHSSITFNRHADIVRTAQPVELFLRKL